MIQINGVQCNKENVYDVLFSLVHSNKSIEELYNFELDIVSENNLEIMCVYEEIVVNYVKKMMS